MAEDFAEELADFIDADFIGDREVRADRFRNGDTVRVNIPHWLTFIASNLKDAEEWTFVGWQQRYVDAPLQLEKVTVNGRCYYVISDMHDFAPKELVHIPAAWAEDIEAPVLDFWHGLQGAGAH
jgi:hypothetical protein